MRVGDDTRYPRGGRKVDRTVPGPAASDSYVDANYSPFTILNSLFEKRATRCLRTLFIAQPSSCRLM